MAVWSKGTVALPRSGRLGAFSAIPRAGVFAERATFGSKSAQTGGVSTGRGVTGGSPRVTRDAAFSTGVRRA